MSITWLTVLASVQTLFSSIGLVLFLIIKPEARRQFLPLGLVLLLAVLVDLLSYVFYFGLGRNANFLQSMYYIITLPMLLHLYRSRIKWPKIEMTINVITIVFLVFGVANFFLIQGIDQLNSYPRMAIGIIMIYFSIHYFYQLLQETHPEGIVTLPMFWINTSMLIYFSATFTVHLWTDYLVNVMKDDFIFYWFIHNFFGLLHYSLIWVGFWLLRKKPKLEYVAIANPAHQ